MPEYLVNYRHALTGAMINVHIVNVDDEQQAIKLASNSLLDEEQYCYDSFESISETNSRFAPVPF